MASTLNADNGSISGSSGLKSSADASGVLALQTNGTTALTVDTSQNVGIGTSSPGSKLHVAGAGTTQITVSNSTPGTSGTPQLTRLGFLGYNGEDRVRIEATDIASSGNGSQLRFYNANTSNVLTENMRIDSSGNVGIGVTSPAYKLDVQSATGNTYIRAVRPAKTTGEVGVLLDGGTGGVPWYIYQGTNSDALSFFYAGERMRIDSSGNLLVGTTSANGKITCNIGSASSSCYTAAFTAGGGSGLGFRSSYENSTGTAYHMYIVYNGTGVGGIISNSTTTTYATSSDYRLKENIAPMQNALGVVAQLKPVTYTWKTDGSDGQGFIAHELQEVVPDCVTGEKDAVDEEGKPVYQGIDTSFLVATLTKAIQELKAEIDSLKAQISG